MTIQTLSGSCLCGALSFSVTGEPARFMHCHCSRCRKATGTGHASNLFVKDGALNWAGDTGLLQSYKIPEAERFTRTFCSRCGGPLPREIHGMNLVMIPAGTLDDEPNIKPQARIFCDSKVSWSCTADGVPCFAGYPE